VPAPHRRGHLSNRSTAAPFRDRGTGLSDRAIARTLDSLDRVDADASVAEVVAAYLAMDVPMTDAEIAAAVRGLAGRPDAEAVVARVRANMAAGHDPGRGIAPTPATETGGQEAPRATTGPVATPERSPAGTGAYARSAP
jgi:hypothetical protein